MTINAAYPVRDYGSPEVSSEKDNKAKPKMKDVYPDITLRGDAARALIEAYEVGEEFTATVKFNFAGKEDREREKPREWESPDESTRCSVELEVISMDVAGKAGMADNEEEESAEQAVDNYRARSSSPMEDEE